MVKELLVVWEGQWFKDIRNNELRREVACLEVTVVIGLGVGLMGEEGFITSIEGLLIFWEIIGRGYTSPILLSI